MVRDFSKLLILTLFVGCTPASSPSDEEQDEDSETSSKEEEPDASPDEEDSPNEDESGEEDEENEDESSSSEESSTGDASTSGDGEEESSDSSEEETDSTESQETDSEGTDSEGTDSGDEEPGDDACDKIKWGKSVKVGGVVPRKEAPGFYDKDGDNKLDDEQTQVGMCELHKTGKKCAIVIFGKENWYPCRTGFRRVGDKAEALKAAGIIVYGEYGRSIKQANDPRRAKQVILGYLGNDYLQMVSGSNSLGFTAAPLKALVDLKTMKLELMEEYTETKLQRYTVDEMIEHCNSLHK